MSESECEGQGQPGPRPPNVKSAKRLQILLYWQVEPWQAFGEKCVRPNSLQGVSTFIDAVGRHRNEIAGCLGHNRRAEEKGPSGIMTWFVGGSSRAGEMPCMDLDPGRPRSLLLAPAAEQ